MINKPTLDERQQPDVVSSSRRKQVQWAQDNLIQDVNNLLKNGLVIYVLKNDEMMHGSGSGHLSMMNMMRGMR